MSKKSSSKTYRLKELCDVTSSKRIYAAEYKDEGIPFYRSKEIIEKQKGKFKAYNNIYISEERYNEIKDNYDVPESGDLLLTSVGTLGVPYIVKNKEKFYFKDGNLIWFKNFKKLNNYYLYYWFLSPSGKAQLKKSTIGSSQSAFTITNLKNVEIELPTIKTQKKITSILSAYDELIENNNRRIKLLEEMAQAIYKEWFVNFKFPGHENVKMMDSELGKIPEVWVLYKVGDILTDLESGSRPKGGVGGIEEGIPSIGAGNINGLGNFDYSKVNYVPIKFYEKMKKGKVGNKDVLLYKDGAKIGRKSMFMNEYPYENCCINEHVFILRTKNCFLQNYLYFWLDQDWMTRKIKNLNSNSAQPGINQKGIKSLPILFPPYKIIVQFNQIVEPILTNLFNFAKQNPLLKKSRDILLPKLISGEIDVSDLDIEVKE